MAAVQFAMSRGQLAHVCARERHFVNQSGGAQRPQNQAPDSETQKVIPTQRGNAIPFWDLKKEFEECRNSFAIRFDSDVENYNL